MLLDLGNGALGALHKYVDPLTIDAVLLSHLHADHCLDLCGYYVLRKYHPSGTQPRIPVWGPAGTAERMARAYDLPVDPGMTAEFDFREWAEPITIGPFTVTPVPVDHPVPAFGLRVSAGGVTFGYTGDTGPCDAVDDVARDADLFLAEASFLTSDGQPARPAPHRGRRGRGRDPGAGPGGWCSPTSRRGTTPRLRWPRRARRTTAP